MSLKEFRERVNLKIYNAKPKVLGTLTILNILFSSAAIGTLVFYYGFDISVYEEKVCFTILETSFAFYILRYLTKLFFDFHPPTFIRSNWFETIIIGLLLVEGIAYNVFGTMIIEPIFTSMGFVDFGAFSMIFVQLFVFLILIQKVIKQRNFKPWMKIHPGWLFTISIAAMTFIGGLLLMLPEMSRVEGGLPFMDSMFLSMSSTSVTGLSTVDISQALTFKGQMIVLILIKLGGLNTIAFGALMLVIAKFGVGIKYHEVIEDFVNRDSILKAKSMRTKPLITPKEKS